MVVLTEISEESSSSSTYKFDVFLSFRGEDTRNNFTDHLLKALKEATIETFFDDEEIQIGEFLKPELENAIKSSRASIIVLSKNYASSTWCLEELALIMEQKRTSKHNVFPIFYHVNPSDVRKQRNSFGDAMAEHEQRMEAETNEEKRSELGKKIEKWKKALTEVAHMKGKESNGRETKLIEEIVKDISSRLELHKRSEIPKLIGMESSVRTITSFLNDASSHTTDVLTIWGMAGIGKTHLADYIFKSHYLEFESSCFLEDIERRCTSQKRLLKLQKQLLKDIRATSWMGIDNVKAATLKIENSLFRKRTFLVLDGINDSEQLDALIGTKGLHPGSKIIITSKNGSLTEKCKLFKTQVPPKHTKHLLHGLNDKDSLQLLTWHAFGCHEPNEGDKKKMKKVVQYCKGHPLALKVLGSSFRSEDATWEDILESLGKEINQILKRSWKLVMILCHLKKTRNCLNTLLVYSLAKIESSLKTY
ncbi:putative TIR domain, P-loop containing nucleoside triphosphate hydrolase [Helianthus annuus]|nr:putative TIR domain, P-loop containing nucleoside triphosphate hydrolase [Helianthus annuus]